MSTKYQFIFIGDNNPYIYDIKLVFIRHILELGISESTIMILETENFKDNYLANTPAFCLYFGNTDGYFKDSVILSRLIDDATLILPVVSNSEEFTQQIPRELWKVNGFHLASSENIEALVSTVLEGLGLLRLSRRLFISYKRDESSSVAIQLFEKLERAGFDVFLDTHSIRPGEVFQEELWHRLADTDIVVLLNTPGFLKSNWTKLELAKASAMSIGILQLIWPKHTPERESELCIPHYLNETDFENGHFTNSKTFLVDNIVNVIVSKAESLRARSLAARQDNIITEFVKAARSFSISVDLQPQKFITIKRTDGKEVVILPTVGVPQAFTYNQSEILIRRIKSKNVAEAYLLYDHRNIQDKWIEHLSWLDSYLPIQTIKLIEVGQWLKKI